MRKDGLVIQGLEFADEGVVSLTWGLEDDVAQPNWGEIRKSWVPLDALPEYVKVNIEHALLDLLEEYSAWKRNASDKLDSMGKGVPEEDGRDNRG